MLKSFWEMGHHLENYSSVSEVSSNWLVFETRGLHTVATLFPEFADAAVWRTLAEQRLTEELTKQVYPDGVQWELAPGYGAGVLKAFRGAHQLGSLNDRPMPARVRGQAGRDVRLFCLLVGPRRDGGAERFGPWQRPFDAGGRV